MNAAFDYLAFFGAAFAGYLALDREVNGACYWAHSSGTWGDWSGRRIQPDRAPAAGQVRREIRLSILNLPFFAFSATVAFGLYRPPGGGAKAPGGPRQAASGGPGALPLAD